MKKITINRAHAILRLIADGVNIQDAGVTMEELLLAARMGATALHGLGQVGTIASKAAEEAMFFCAQVAALEGDDAKNEEPNGRPHIVVD